MVMKLYGYETAIRENKKNKKTKTKQKQQQNKNKLTVDQQ